MALVDLVTRCGHPVNCSTWRPRRRRHPAELGTEFSEWPVGSSAGAARSRNGFRGADHRMYLVSVGCARRRRRPGGGRRRRAVLAGAASGGAGEFD